MRTLKEHSILTKVVFWFVLVLSINNLLNIDDQEIAGAQEINRIESFVELIANLIHSDNELNDYPDEMEDSSQFAPVIHSYTMNIIDIKIEAPLVQEINFRELSSFYSFDLPLPKSPPPKLV
ncbi:hypothetical protein [Saccharicrinis aurantiacus]|uniref:hypothetical protein n=1 Tax=Saccharicrinis aurantiacus TaxID=1849719 RepID=UPI002491678F|nr:hypothetical protein [Saccharicrinis aurantiacus]